MDFIDDKNIIFNSNFFEELKKNHLDKFTDKLNEINIDDNSKTNIYKILCQRLNGILPNFSIGQENSSGFDWEYKINLDQVDYLNQFNEFYFEINSLDYFEDEIFYKSIICPTLNSIQKYYSKINSFEVNSYDNIKKIMATFLFYNDEFYNGKIKLEYVLIIFRLKNFIDLVNTVYPGLLDVSKANIELSKTIGFSNFIHKISSNIKNNFKEFLINKKEGNEINSLNKNLYMSQFYDVEKNIKSIFWLIYHNDIKYVDTIYKNYFIDNELLEKIDQDISDKFSFEENEIFLLYIEKVKKDFMDVIEPKVYAQEDFASVDEIANLIDLEIQNFMSRNFDSDEKYIIENTLKECRDVLLLSTNLKKTTDILAKFIK